MGLTDIAATQTQQTAGPFSRFEWLLAGLPQMSAGLALASGMTSILIHFVMHGE